MTPKELVLNFGGSYVCANFGENLSRNVMRECTQTDRQTHTQMQTGFIVCPMLYAIALGQIKIILLNTRSIQWLVI